MTDTVVAFADGNAEPEELRPLTKDEIDDVIHFTIQALGQVSWARFGAVVSFMTLHRDKLALVQEWEDCRTGRKSYSMWKTLAESYRDLIEEVKNV